MSESCVVWFADAVTGRPERTTCTELGYPNHDAQGRVMYVNTHFTTECEAWLKVRSETKAAFQLDAREVMRLRAELIRVERIALEAALLADRVDVAFAEFEKAEAPRV